MISFSIFQSNFSADGSKLLFSTEIGILFLFDKNINSMRYIQAPCKDIQSLSLSKTHAVISSRDIYIKEIEKEAWNKLNTPEDLKAESVIRIISYNHYFYFLTKDMLVFIYNPLENKWKNIIKRNCEEEVDFNKDHLYFIDNINNNLKITQISEDLEVVKTRVIEEKEDMTFAFNKKLNMFCKVNYDNNQLFYCDFDKFVNNDFSWKTLTLPISEKEIITDIASSYSAIFVSTPSSIYYYDFDKKSWKDCNVVSIKENKSLITFSIGDDENIIENFWSQLFTSEDTIYAITIDGQIFEFDKTTQSFFCTNRYIHLLSLYSLKYILDTFTFTKHNYKITLHNFEEEISRLRLQRIENLLTSSFGI